MATRRTSPIDVDFPSVAKLILQDYQSFVAHAAEAPDDAITKAFAARHAAGRGALAHLEQLLKLAGDTVGEAEVTRIGESLSEWRAIMPPPAKEEPEADDDGAGG
jgi:hypothetical protein